MTLMTCGVIYSAVMMSSAFLFRLPNREVYPEAAAAAAAAAASAAASSSSASASAPAAPARESYVPVEAAMKAPQLYMIWGVSTLNAVAGISLIGCAKGMMSEIYGTALPGVVDGSYASGYVAMLSVGNMAGRFGWASAADLIGPKNIFNIFALTVPICLAVPLMTTWVADDPGTLPLYSFMGATFLATTFYGGNFAVMPSYCADTFGAKDAAPIYGG